MELTLQKYGSYEKFEQATGGSLLSKTRIWSHVRKYMVKEGCLGEVWAMGGWGLGRYGLWGWGHGWAGQDFVWTVLFSWLDWVLATCLLLLVTFLYVSVQHCMSFSMRIIEERFCCSVLSHQSQNQH